MDGPLPRGGPESLPAQVERGVELDKGGARRHVGRRDHRAGWVFGIPHRHGDAGGGVTANPFSTPDDIYISKRPQDMCTGIQRPASIIAADFGRDSMGGSQG